MKSREVYKYQLKVRNKVVHIGITSDLKRREAEHQKEFPDSHIKQLGHRTTRDGAMHWERQERNKRKFEPKEFKKLSTRTSTKLAQRRDRILNILDKRR